MWNDSHVKLLKVVNFFLQSAYYDPGAGYTPHCKFSLSNWKNPYAQFKILYPIETEQIYFVVIEFNQSWNTITMTNDSSTITLIDAPRVAARDERFLNTNP